MLVFDSLIVYPDADHQVYATVTVAFDEGRQCPYIVEGKTRFSSLGRDTRQHCFTWEQARKRATAQVALYRADVARSVAANYMAATWYQREENYRGTN